ncbi:MAG: hypothetical protein K5790_03100 [Nitrosopumilus sp.]|uniref:hypothetical protein n=1 Tax=Nitrosopumilus sp. TaxID=2024843 RepID=UPI00247BDBC0|nr:hypothetical protein [Nitrosopumilus sp.]MCV0392264.1 hypothetical protein [Nitrosopumilus sp.]
MKTKLSKKRAISTVLTTVIILVSSVVLGSGVVLYGTSLFQGGTQSEAISVSGSKMWVHDTASEGLAWGAAKIRNTGDKVISVDTIQVRGTNVPFSQWYPDTSVNATLFQQSLIHPGWSGTGGMLDATGATQCAVASTVQIDLTGDDVDTSSICANAATGPVGLSPGSSAIIYFKLTNGTITSLDSGASTTLNIFAGKAGAPQSITVQGQS